MLKTIYQIGQNIGKDKSRWDDIVANPSTPKDEGKKKLVLPVEFNIDSGEVRFLKEDIREFSKSDLISYRALKIQGGNNKAIYIAVPLPKLEQLVKTLFGKPDKEGVYPEKGEFIAAIDSIAPEVLEMELYKVLEEIVICREPFLKLVLDEKNAFSISQVVKETGIGKDETIVMIYATVTSEKMGLDQAPIGHLPGYELFIEKKFFAKQGRKESEASKPQLCYATGVIVPDIQAAEFSDRYNINKFFVKTTKNYASGFEEGNYSKNYQLSSAIETALNRGSHYLLEHAKVKIAGISHVIIPEFLNQELIEFPMKVKKQSELLFDYNSVQEIIANVEDNTAIEGLYWLNYIAIDSDGNYFKVGNQIKDVSRLHLQKVFQALTEAGNKLKPWLGDRYAFNLYAVYKSIPIRGAGMKNSAYAIFKSLLEQRPIEKRELMAHFTELVLCHRFESYKAYSNFKEYDQYSKDKFPFALRESVFRYLAFMYALRQLELIEPHIKMESMENVKSNIAQEEEAFLSAMGFSKEQRALFHLGRALHTLVRKQTEKGHKKNALDKLNYNGMDKQAISRFSIELFEASRHYDISNKIEWPWGAYSRNFDLQNWDMDPHEALFYILSGYTYLIKNKSQDETNESDNQN